MPRSLLRVCSNSDVRHKNSWAADIKQITRQPLKLVNEHKGAYVHSLVPIRICQYLKNVLFLKRRHTIQKSLMLKRAVI